MGWLFKVTPQGFWNNKENRIKYLNWFEERLQLFHLDSWYRVSRDNFHKNYGSSLVSFYKTDVVLKAASELHSEIPWEKEKFDRFKKQQWLLYKIITELFPQCEVKWEHFFEDLKFKKSSLPLGVDIYLPEIKLAIEYQGEQHFRPVPSWGGKNNHEKIMERDKEKKEKLKQKGIFLIEVDYHWDGSKAYIEGILSIHANFFHAITVSDKAVKLSDLDTTWDEYYLKLEEHKSVYGNLDVHINNSKNKKLINWINAQRKLYHENKLDVNRISKLNLIGFDFGIYNKKKSWYKWFEELKNFIKINGHGDVPQRCKLGRWCNKQRMRYANQKNSEDKEWLNRIKLLESVGFVWNIKLKNWGILKKKIIGFVHINGHGRIPSKDENDDRLGRFWPFSLRRDKKLGKLSLSRIQELTSIGFSWEPQEEIWLEHYQALEEFKDRFGYCDVPLSYQITKKNNVINLGRWYDRQKQTKRKGKLSEHKLLLLDEIWG